MYLSDRDLAWAIECGKLVFDPLPERIDSTSIDLHLDSINAAKIWDIEKYANQQASAGRQRPELRICHYKLGDFGAEYLISPPKHKEGNNQLVSVRGEEVILRTGGFMLWQTKEVVGTNLDKNADLICFVDGKSTRARAGILVHLTAPTIHTTWSGKITLELANLGPFDIVLQENDVIAQLTVAKVTSSPAQNVSAATVTLGQKDVSGSSSKGG